MTGSATTVAGTTPTQAPRVTTAARQSAWRRMTNTRSFWVALFVVNLTTFFVVWELFARTETINPIFLPAPSAVLAALGEAWASGELAGHIVFSLTNLAVGVAIAAAVGIPLGLAAGTSDTVERLVSPYIWAMASLPRVAWLPLLVMIFGYTNTSKLVLIFMAAVFPMVINSMAGVKSVDGSLLIAGRVFGASWLDRYLLIVVPHTIPYIFSGFKQGLARALAAVVVSEMFGGSQGVGFVMVIAAKRFDSALLFAMLLLIVIAALVVVKGADWLENSIAPWRRR